MSISTLPIWSKFACLLVCTGVCFLQSTLYGADGIAGKWTATLKSPGGALCFGLEFAQEKISTNKQPTGFIINGPERIKIPIVQWNSPQGKILIPHYDSKIEFRMVGTELKGTWTKRKGADRWSRMEFSAKRLETESSAEQSVGKKEFRPFIGTWRTKFRSDEDDSVAVFRWSDLRQRIVGTFMTTTGDYRYLDSQLMDEKLVLSCFDGAHAFLFRVDMQSEEGDDRIRGDFWSSDSWHDTFEGVRDSAAKLADAFGQTSVADKNALGSLTFPDLEGRPTRLNDIRFRAKARIIYVFGSWCPNCHDAAAYFSELTEKFGAELSIVGLAFEHTGDFDRDAEQVRQYLKRHGASYPVLIAGLSDKKMASKAFPVLDRIRSYPTTIFLDESNQVVAIHTGFTGPATGREYKRLKQKFESIIKKLVSN